MDVHTADVVSFAVQSIEHATRALIGRERDFSNLVYLRDRLKHAVNTLKQRVTSIPDYVTLSTACTALLHNVNDVLDSLGDFAPHSATIAAASKESLQWLKHNGFTTTKIAELHNVNGVTVDRWINKFGIRDECKYTALTDEQLVELIAHIKEDSPNSGCTMVLGYLRARGYKVQREPVRRALRSFQVPAGTVHRRFIKRRVYSVPSCNSLWHMDGNHKLITWGFVVHGAIDGFSRTITFLKCSTNNSAITVLAGFTAAVREYGIPSRIRTDKGGENFDTWKFMVAACGSDRGSYIAGRSVHNQRIERLWRDVTDKVLSKFRETFFILEDNGYMDVESDEDIIILHHVYLPRINKCLENFFAGWNNHSVRTEHNRSPRQIWTEAALSLGIKGKDPSEVPVDSIEDSLITPGGIRPKAKLVRDVSRKHTELWSLLRNIPTDVPMHPYTSVEPFVRTKVAVLELRREL